MKTGILMGIDADGAGKSLTDLQPLTETLDAYKEAIAAPPEGLARLEVWTRKGVAKRFAVKPEKAEPAPPAKKKSTKKSTAKKSTD